MTRPRFRALFAYLCVVAVVAATLGLSARDVTAQSGETAIALDADTAQAGVQAELAAPVAVGETFHVRAVLQSLGAEVYGAYQVTIKYPAASVEPVGLPDNWGDEPTAETGGNLLQFTSGALCDPSPTRNSISQAVAGVGSMAMTCAEVDFAETTSNTGELVDMVFRCIAPGPVALGLSDIADTFILDPHLLNSQSPDDGIFGDTFTGATVQCAGEALTATPAGEETPTQEAAGTSVASTPSGGSPQATPSAQPNGAGGADDDDDGGAPWALIIIIGIVAAVAVGGGLVFAVRRGRV